MRFIEFWFWSWHLKKLLIWKMPWFSYLHSSRHKTTVIRRFCGHYLFLVMQKLGQRNWTLEYVGIMWKRDIYLDSKYNQWWNPSMLRYNQNQIIWFVEYHGKRDFIVPMYCISIYLNVILVFKKAWTLLVSIIVPEMFWAFMECILSTQSHSYCFRLTEENETYLCHVGQ